MQTTVRREAWRSTGELTGARSIDWARARRRSRVRRGFMRAVSSLLGILVRSSYRGTHTEKTATATARPQAADTVMWTVPS